MKCEGARDSIILAAYGELPDEQVVQLEQHLAACEDCLAELHAIRAMDADLRLHPLTEPDPNLLAQSRMRLDEALDNMPRGSFADRFGAHAVRWFSHLQSAPALATLLVGVGFLGGNFTYRYQVAHAPRVAPPVILTNTSGGGISTVSEIRQLPNDMVQVSYNRVVPEMAEGTLNDPQIRSLLMVGTKAATTNIVRVDSVALLAGQCRDGHACRAQDNGDVRRTLLVSLRTDRSPGVRLKALDGLQPWVGQDENVRDAVLQALLTDSSAAVRTRAVSMLGPVESDSSVRQALRTVSTTDENPYLRTVSTHALEGGGSIQ